MFVMYESKVIVDVINGDMQSPTREFEISRQRTKRKSETFFFWIGRLILNSSRFWTGFEW